MNRTLLVFAPFQALVCAVSFDNILSNIMKKKKHYIILILLFLLCVFQSNNCTHYASDVENYVHFQIETPQGVELSDDHRELYQYIRHQGKNKPKIVSFWDIAYQMQALSNCVTYNDGNTNNRTHMSNIEMIYSENENNAWTISRSLDADYIVVTFGGASNYENDDIMKFPLILQNLPNFFSNISLSDYQNDDVFLVCPNMRPKMLKSMLVRFSYNNFKKFTFGNKTKPGYDTIRGCVVKYQASKMTKFTEAYTTSNWLLRLYKVSPDPIWNRVY